MEIIDVVYSALGKGDDEILHRQAEDPERNAAKESFGERKGQKKQYFAGLQTSGDGEEMVEYMGRMEKAYKHL